MMRAQDRAHRAVLAVVFSGSLMILPEPVEGGMTETGFESSEEVAEIFAGLPEKPVLESSERVDPSPGTSEHEGDRVFRFRSSRSIRETESGLLFARFRLTVSRWSTSEAAGEAIRRRLESANPDAGISYAWDSVMARGAVVFHLHAECTYSEQGFRRLEERLTDALAERPGGIGAFFRCRCGGGCRPVLPLDDEQIDEPSNTDED